jgi:collagenase-like PrtC family protease
MVHNLKSFKIAAPFINIQSIKELKIAGANELYCGFVDKLSEKRWPLSLQLMNRRVQGQSLGSFDVLKDAASESEKNSMPLYIAMNGLYSKNQYPWIIKTIDKLAAIRGIKGLIVADIGLLLILKKMNYDKDICISTGGTTFNKYTIDFFSSFGAKRIVLDRQLSISEILGLLTHSSRNLCFEIFVFHQGCMFVDGYCTFFHWGGEEKRIEISKNLNMVRKYCNKPSAGCSEILKLMENKEFQLHYSENNKKHRYDLKYDPLKYPYGCNLCNLFKLNKFKKNIILKVAGRGERGLDIVNTVRNISDCVKLLNQGNTSYDKYKSICRNKFTNIKKSNCSSYSCYCPPDLVGNA